MRPRRSSAYEAATTTTVTPTTPPSHVNGLATHSAHAGIDRAIHVAMWTSRREAAPPWTTSAASAA